MRLIVFSPELDVHDEKELISWMFSEGLEYLHLRKPNYSKEKLANFLDKFKYNELSKIMLHEHIDLSNLYAIKGININMKNKSQLSEVKTEALSYSASCHSFEELDKEEPFNCQYKFISPVFDSISKENYNSKFSHEELSNQLKIKRNFDVIALGGIIPENISKCKSLGFDGVAVLGSLWQSKNIKESFLKIKELCQN
ncbi:MAG: thiamine phosphate synthase [Bacteroidia bacterium]